VFDATVNAFSLSARNMSSDRQTRFFVGNSFFNKNWVVAGNSTTGRDGLGPTFNARSCSTCHRKDGRGRPPAPGEAFTSMLLRLSVPGVDPHGGPQGAGPYGDQLQSQAIDGVPVEGLPRVTYVERPGSFADGTPYSLRVPTYTIDAPALGPLPDDLLVSPRVAPAMIGMGLLEAIPEADLRALADPDDATATASPAASTRSGTPRPAPSRPAASAGRPTSRACASRPPAPSSATWASPPPCSPTRTVPGQPACSAALAGGAPEIADELLADVVFYSSTLAVPARRDLDDPATLRGEQGTSSPPAATPATPRATAPPPTPPSSRPPARRSSPTATSSSTTWAPSSPTAAPTSSPPATSGAPRRCGASASSRPSTATPSSSTTAAPAPCSRRCCGTVARPSPARDAVLALSADERADLVAFLASL
jgi:CxxC motif-containing protein (DUF1111 family)